MNNWDNCDCFQKSKDNTTDLHQSMYCYYFVIYENNCRGGPKQKCLNPSQSDFKCLSDFRFQKKMLDSIGFGFGIRHIPTQCDTVTVTLCPSWLQELVSLFDCSSSRQLYVPVSYTLDCCCLCINLLYMVSQEKRTGRFYARQHICYSAYMPRQFRPSVCHTRVLCQNGWTYHRNSFTIW